MPHARVESYANTSSFLQVRDCKKPKSLPLDPNETPAKPQQYPSEQGKGESGERTAKGLPQLRNEHTGKSPSIDGTLQF